MNSYGKFMGFCVFAALGTPAHAQSVVADPGRGRDIAESLCSTCHVVDATPGNVAKSDISSFYSIATSLIRAKNE